LIRERSVAKPCILRSYNKGGHERFERRGYVENLTSLSLVPGNGDSQRASAFRSCKKGPNDTVTHLVHGSRSDSVVVRHLSLWEEGANRVTRGNHVSLSIIQDSIGVKYQEVAVRAWSAAASRKVQQKREEAWASVLSSSRPAKAFRGRILQWRSKSRVSVSIRGEIKSGGRACEICHYKVSLCFHQTERTRVETHLVRFLQQMQLGE